VISGATNAVVATVTVGILPEGIGFNLANGDVYVPNTVSGTVSVISGSTNTLRDTVTVGDYPFGVAYDSANGYVYVSNTDSATVSVISPSVTAPTPEFPGQSVAATLLAALAVASIAIRLRRGRVPLPWRR
jgi:YVTN family beta-propeller protein